MIGWALRWVLLWCGVAMVCRAEGRRRLAAAAQCREARNRIGQRHDLGRAAAPGPATNTLVYPTDARGHVVLDAVVNGASMRFLVDTGASLVTLTLADARAAGLTPGELVFNRRASTANGPVRMAPVTLREIRLGQLSIGEVPAAVIENLNVSLLGMSFLARLQSYEMRGGKLTITW